VDLNKLDGIIIIKEIFGYFPISIHVEGANIPARVVTDIGDTSAAL
jgi:hypothetical protein